MAEPDLINSEDSIIVVPDILYGDDSLRRTKVLIVDDELSNVHFLERILLRVRIENFRSTTDSATALSLFKQFRPDLVLIDWLIAERDTKSEPTALDADLLLSPLVLRNWRPGDSYRPRGRRQIQKLKKMFLAGRIPSRDRGLWPVLESGGQVVWARGMPPAEEFCARAGTRAGVVIEEDRF